MGSVSTKQRPKWQVKSEENSKTSKGTAESVADELMDLLTGSADHEVRGGQGELITLSCASRDYTGNKCEIANMFTRDLEQEMYWRISDHFAIDPSRIEVLRIQRINLADERPGATGQRLTIIASFDPPIVDQHPATTRDGGRPPGGHHRSHKRHRPRYKRKRTR